jgi:hypothetical protein
MTALECVRLARAEGPDYQRVVNGFIDAFRRASSEEKRRLIAEPIARPGTIEGLVSAVVSALCRDASIDAPSWVESIGSPEPFFAFPAKGFALRVRLMVESPAPFRVRNVFVPENYLSRA